MTHYKSDNLDNVRSISKPKANDLTAKQIHAGSIKKKYPVILDRKTTVYISHKPTEKDIIELKAKYKIT
jgi:hypothetical protein